MSATGTVADHLAHCAACGEPSRTRVCSACQRESAALAASAPTAPKARVRRSRVKPLTDAEIARGLGQADQLADYRANGWKSGLRERPEDRPKAALGAGRITGTTAVPSHRLIDARADRGQDRTRVPGEIVNAIGKLAHAITHASGPEPRKCAELLDMLGEVARSGCISNARLRRQVDLANAALALAAMRG